MHKKIRVFIALLAVGLFVAPASGILMSPGAAPTGITSRVRNANVVVVKRGKLSSIIGEVIQIDSKGKRFTIESGENKITLDVSDNTIIAAGKTKRSFSDLHVGDRVVVRMTEEGDKKIAHAIRIARIR